MKPLRSELAALGRFVKPKTHKVNGYSSPTPVSDGTHVYVLYGTGVAACFTLEGKRVWGRQLEKPKNAWGHCATPVLADGVFVAAILGLTALDARTGEQRWRATSAARWGSPQLARIGGTSVVMTANGEAIRLADGKTLATGPKRLEYNSPLVQDGIAYYIQNGGGAYQLPDAAREGMPLRRLWRTSPKKDRYYASPLLHDGLIYAVTRRGVLSVIDAANGKVIYARDMKLGRGEAYPSPCLAGAHVFIGHEKGATVVIKPGRTYQEVARNKMEPYRATPVFLDKRMILRGLKHLYCIGTR
jgi:outer membrane protein assembly factor BamB